MTFNFQNWQVVRHICLFFAFLHSIKKNLFLYILFEAQNRTGSTQAPTISSTPTTEFSLLFATLATALSVRIQHETHN